MNEELVLSDVHVWDDSKACNLNHGNSDNNRRYISRFCFKNVDNKLKINNKLENKSNDVKNLEFDQDGDYILTRNWSPKLSSHPFTIEHSMETTLSNVGQQVWLGSFLLSDFLLHSGEDLLLGKTVLELGCGTGMCGIVASVFADKVFCTDLDGVTLDICKHNIEHNKDLHEFFDLKKNLSQISVKELDWSKYETCWNFEQNDLEELFNVDILIAADVIYQEKLTDDFFATLMKFMLNGKSKVLYLSIEKRINFTLDAMDIAAPAYQYFCDWLLELSSMNCNWKGKRIDTNFEKYFEYNRVPQLELWKIEYVKSIIF